MEKPINDNKLRETVKLVMDVHDEIVTEARKEYVEVCEAHFKAIENEEDELDEMANGIFNNNINNIKVVN